MAGQAFRFLAAGGFALDQPPSGLSEVPEPLVELLIDAPYQAAQRVFDTAFDQRLDFVVLTGDLLDLTCSSPRAIAFLLDQFQRLSGREIAIYWAGGRLDSPQDWPAAVRLPPGVHVFPSSETQELCHFRGDRPLAHLVGRSWHGTASIQVGDLKSDADGLPTIVVTYGPSNHRSPPRPLCGSAPRDECRAPSRSDGRRSETTMADQAVEFWALGGQPRPQTLSAGKGLLHYTGSPQGRTPDDPGPHGCTLVNVNGDRTVHTEFVPTDALRWHTEHVSIEEGATLKSVRDQLSERARKLIAEAESRPLIVSWMVCGGQHLAGPAARRDLAAEWQAWLRQEFFIRDSKPALWTHALELEQPQLPEPWFEEESMLGDFLRRLREFAASPTDAASLAEAIPPHHRTDALSALAQWLPEEHRAVFDEAALTGAQLLGAGERET